MCAHVRLLWMMSPKNFVSFPFNNVFHNKTQLFLDEGDRKKSKIKTIWRARAIDSKRHIRRPREVKTMERSLYRTKLLYENTETFNLHLTSKNKSRIKIDKRINTFCSSECLIYRIKGKVLKNFQTYTNYFIATNTGI